jgi:integrase
MSAAKSMAVEDWLRNLALAPKTKSHVRSLMHTIFQCAERWELIDKNPIKLVRVKGGTRSVVHGEVGDVKTEYSRDSVPLDTAVIEARMLHKERSFSTPGGWLFANPMTCRPYHREEIQKSHIRGVGVAAGIGGDIGWHTFRHSYRSWLDETGAPLTVQKELMCHASIQTTMNIYGKAMTDSKRPGSEQSC